MQHLYLTCTVEGEEEEEQAGDQVAQESDYPAGDTFRDRVHGLDEELKEYGHTAVDKNAHQDTGSVQDGCEKGTTTTSQNLIGNFDVMAYQIPSEQLFINCSTLDKFMEQCR